MLPKAGWLAAAGPDTVCAPVSVGSGLSVSCRASAVGALVGEDGFLLAFGFLCRVAPLLPSAVGGFLSALDSLPLATGLPVESSVWMAAALAGSMLATVLFARVPLILPLPRPLGGFSEAWGGMSDAEASSLPSTLLLRLASAFLAAAARLHAHTLLLNAHLKAAQHAADERRCNVSEIQNTRRFSDLPVPKHRDPIGAAAEGKTDLSFGSALRAGRFFAERRPFQPTCCWDSRASDHVLVRPHIGQAPLTGMLGCEESVCKQKMTQSWQNGWAFYKAASTWRPGPCYMGCLCMRSIS